MMLLEFTIAQLDVGFVPEEQAEEMGHLGYLQWLGSLPCRSDYISEAMYAYDRARPFIPSSPAIAVFCQLLVSSAAAPLQPLDLKLPSKTRRGGAKARRSAQ